MDIEQIYIKYQDKISKVDEVLHEHTSKSTELINLITKYIINSGGKRLRPLLTIISAELCNVDNDRHINLAAAVEFIHTATLLHDDVIDESKMRRHHPTANSIWDNKACILVGDFLFSQAFELMVQDKSLEVLAVLAKASSVISEGEVMQLSEIGNLHLTYDNYIKIITAKTAELFAASCKIAPLTAKDINYSYVSLLENFGLKLGIIFQIIDDIIDYSKSPKKGKNQGDDFYEGKVTLPLMIARDNATPQELSRLTHIFNEQNFSPENFIFIEELILKYNALEESQKFASKYFESALETLESFSSSRAKESLFTILKFSSERKF